MTTTTGGNRSRIIGLLVAAVAMVAALVVAVLLVIGWFDARADASVASTRDDALSGSRQAAINLNSVDSNNLDQTFADIESSITGDELIGGLADTKDQFRQQFESSDVVTTATVQHAALVSFSQDDSTATSLIVLETNTIKPDGNELYLSTLRLDMLDDNGTWKATKIQPIGQRIPLSSPDAAATDGSASAAPSDPASPPATNAPAAPTDPTAPTAGQ